MLPAKENHGIWFERTDISEHRLIPALWSSVSETDLCTKISNDAGIGVATIEHMMAALAALEIDNVLIQIDGPELPVMDGSAEPFIKLIMQAGIQEQTQPRRIMRILKDITVNGTMDRRVSIKPSTKFAIDYTIDFSNRTAMQPQQFLFSGSMSRMREEIGRARTYGFLEDVEKMRAAGFGLGGSLDNAVVIDQGRIMNADGLRYTDEFVRHKILDAVGDLYLAGAAVKGFYQAYNGGHTLNNRLLRALMTDPTAWAWDETIEKSPRLWQPLVNDMFELQVMFGS